MSTLLDNFDFIKPTSLGQLRKIVADYIENDKNYAFTAGGTDVIPQLKTQLFKLDNLISLTGLQELKGINKQDNLITIGALTTLAELSNNALITKHFPVLATASHKVASPQIRNRATIGGNIMVDNRCIYVNQSTINRESHSLCFKAGGDICHVVKSAKRGDATLCQARFVSDTAPVLLLLNAEVNIVGQQGARKVKLAEIYKSDGIDNKNLSDGELITSIEVNIPKNSKLHYEKLAIRNALDFPSLGVAVRITGEESISIALTGLNTHPGLFNVSIKDYGSFEEMVSDLCEQTADFAVTYQQDFFPRAYRKKMVPVFIRRAIENMEQSDG